MASRRLKIPEKRLQIHVKPNFRVPGRFKVRSSINFFKNPNSVYYIPVLLGGIYHPAKKLLFI